MIIVRLLSPGPWLVGTTKVYPGVGADIVMESITLINKTASGIVTLDGAKTHRQQHSGKTIIRLEESKLNTTNWQPGPVQG
jgi:hypothetical protein